MDSRNEMEARLYAVVHHSVGNFGSQINLPFIPSEPFMYNQSINNNQNQRHMEQTRYWRFATSTNTNFSMNRNSQNNNNHRSAMGYNHARMMNIPNIPSGNRPRILNPYTPYLNYSNMNNNNNGSDGRNYPNHQNTNNNNNHNNRHFNKRNNKNNNRNNHTHNNRNNINLTKEQRVGKYNEKKQRVEAIKQKKQVNQQHYTDNKYNIQIPSFKSIPTTIPPKETVILTSSDEDDEAVIVIPVPSPPTVCIEDSDNEDENDILFATPDVPSCSGIHRNKPDRPISPTSSIVSDDFIIQNDRSRINTANISITEDDELQCRQPTVASILNNSSVNNIDSSASVEDVNEEDLAQNNDKHHASASSLSASDDKFATPQKIKNYEVTDATSSIRQTDVYESAESSDIPESIYDRFGQNQNTKLKTTAKDHSIESDSVEPIIESRIKKLHKRKSSGSNKGSEYASSNDEEEQEADDAVYINRDKTSTPYIVRGSAVDNPSMAKDAKLIGVPRAKPKSKRQKFNSINQSDDDFISTLSNIICNSDADMNDDEDTPPNITAKDLIESIDVTNEEIKKKSKKDLTAAEKNTQPMELEDNSEPQQVISSNDVQDNNVVTIDDASSNEGNAAEPSVVIVNDSKNMTKKRRKISLVDECTGEIGWNNEMKNFYNESWGGENFDLDEIQSKMKGTQWLWKIKNTDKFPIEKYGKANKIRCLNCSELGHVRAKCPQPHKKPICRMCGSHEHKEPRCTNKICLKCGSPNIVFSAACGKCRFQNTSKCGVCKLKGHATQYCPDAWRRYHSTTSDNTPLQDQVKYAKVKYCSICASKGHLAENCNSALCFLDSPAPTSKIMTHTPSYPIQKNPILNKSPNRMVRDSVLNESHSGGGGDVILKLQKYVSLDKKTYFGRFVNAMEMQANEKKMMRLTKKKSKMLLNPFSKIQKFNEEGPPATSTSNIENFSFSEEMSKLNATHKKDASDQSFTLDFITRDNSKENLPSTSAASFITPDKIGIIVNESDSNYSFSEFYDKGDEQNDNEANETLIEKPSIEEAAATLDGQGQNNIIPEKPKIIEDKTQSVEEPIKKVGRNDHMVEQDYIPLTMNDDEEDNSAEKSQTSGNIMLNESEDAGNSEQECTAKIYLTKQDSDLLLSFSGKYIISSLLTKYKLIVKMEWQSKGNVLNITGLPSEQDKFHHDFVTRIQEARKEMKRKQLEQSLQVPKHKQPLIKFIENLFSMLKINLGDVNQVFRKMNYNENLSTRNGQKMADRSRRVLNMILFGQTGLRDGKKHLDALKNILGQLKCPEEIPITVEFRNEVFRHVKYIFTPFEHPDYSGAIKEYYDQTTPVSSSAVDTNKEMSNNKTTSVADIEGNGGVVVSFKKSKDASVELPEHIVASQEWSAKCKDLVDKCRSLLDNDECSAKIISKLDRVYDKALKSELNFLDYQALQKIMSKIQGKSMS